MPRQEDKTEWSQNRYHTPKDDNNVEEDKGDGVHSKELLEYQLSVYSALAMYIDGTPALELDFTSRCDDLEVAIKGPKKYATEESVKAYKAALEDLRTAAAENLEAAKGINAEYEEAYAAGDEKNLGSLEVGKYADFIVLDQDLTAIDPQEILDTQVLATYLGGTCVFER